MTIKCSKCFLKIGRNDLNVSCNQCKHYYHIKCGGLTVESYQSMDDKELLNKWLCSFCKLKKNTSSTGIQTDSADDDIVTVSVAELKHLFTNILNQELQPLIQQIDSLKSEIQQLSNQNTQLREDVVKLARDNGSSNKTPDHVPTSSATSARETYAETVAKSINNTVIVRPKDKSQTINKTKSDIMANIDSVASSVSKVKNLKDGGILLGCQDITRFKRLADDKLAGAYDIREVSTLKPRIRIAGISKDVSESSVLDFLVKQNEFIFSNDEENVYKLIKFLPVKNKSDRFQVIVEVDIASYKKAISIGHCLIGLDRCSIFCGIDIFRCFTCNGFNHSSSSCKSNVICPRCAGNHSVKECQAEKLRCINCTNMKSSGNHDQINDDHAAWDRDNCHSYSAAINKIKRDVFGLSS
ncbi:hypothetical protein Zmor_001720 [Zophobas morio]|uniref:PHD-type domain-containing protein n=1 Tax=Zophobas morio TaxID=2755281 RepID=A0AA38J7Y6_9CUCU|nr:hypothetical protein Zmor_001720 [Zophobas morio]